MVRLIFEMGSPVGGISVAKHLEFNVVPLELNIHHNLISAMISFFRPPRPKEKEGLEKREKDSMKAANSILGGPAGFDGDVDTGDGVGTSADDRVVREGNHANSDRQGSDDLLDIMDSQSRVANHEDTNIAVMRERASNNLTFKYVRFGELSVLVSYRGGTAFTLHIEDFEKLKFKIHALTYNNRTVGLISFLAKVAFHVFLIVISLPKCSANRLLRRVRKDIILDVLSQAGRNFKNLGVYLQDKLGMQGLIQALNSGVSKSLGLVGGGEEGAKTEAMMKGRGEGIDSGRKAALGMFDLLAKSPVQAREDDEGDDVATAQKQESQVRGDKDTKKAALLLGGC